MGLFFLLLGTLVAAVSLSIGAKITGNSVSFLSLLLIALTGNVIWLIPVAGWVLPPMVMGVMLARFGEMDVWPDVVLTMVVSWVLNGALLLAAFSLWAPGVHR